PASSSWARLCPAHHLVTLGATLERDSFQAKRGTRALAIGVGNAPRTQHPACAGSARHCTVPESHSCRRPHSGTGSLGASATLPLATRLVGATQEGVQPPQRPLRVRGRAG